ncbi:MAG: Asp-tRNA(Asn)/Glu-tRNA(Gln) amidotransferase subunit GatC [Anaerolineae bacterium]
MALTLDEVKHIAALAHLELEERTLLRYREQLSAILDYAAQVQAVETETIPPTATVLPLRSVLREDVAGTPLEPDEALSNAPDTLTGCFFVPSIFEKE